MKSILMSIKPEWIAKILNGEKTIEVRKTAPKCELPITVYIYCTQGKYLFAPNGWNEHWWVQKYFSGEGKYNGKVVAKFTLERIDDIGKYAYAFKDSFFYETLKSACLTTEDLTKYAPIKRDEWERNGMKLYAWHIEDLIIFDRPRGLCEFHTNVKKEPPEELLCPECGKPMEYYEYKYLTKSPQNFCYVEEDE